MMYVADELPPEDRAEVERRLAADTGLRAEFELLREAHVSFAATMGALDRSTRPSVPEPVAVARVARAMRQWHADRLVRPAARDPKPAPRYPWWTYPLAAAASVVIAFVVWWGNAEPEAPRLTGRNVPLHFDTEERPSTQDMLAAMIFATSSPFDPTDDLAALVDPSDYAILAPLMDESDLGEAGQPDQQPAELQREQDDWYLYL